jgi:hypothetical protein
MVVTCTGVSGTTTSASLAVAASELPLHEEYTSATAKIIRMFF